MPAEKTTAIVLRVVDFSETSCVVTMFTREFGKITALAKGARRRKNPFEAALDLLALCRIVFLRKTSGAMDLLTEAKLERRFRCGERDLNRLYVGYYIVELLIALTDQGDPHPDVFDLAVEAITQFDQPNGGAKDIRQRLLMFELGLLTRLGHQPIFTKCASCGKTKYDQNRVSFGLIAGGVICQNCRTRERTLVSLSSNGWQYLNTAINLAADERNNLPNQLESLPPPSGEVRKLLSKYITHLVGYRLKLHQFINNMNCD